MLSKGEKIHVITRRLFDGDQRRHFVGEVQEASAATARLRGCVFVFDEHTKEFVRREDIRTRVVSLIDAGLIMNVLPVDVKIEEVEYVLDGQGRRVLTDRRNFAMNVSEFGLHR